MRHSSFTQNPLSNMDAKQTSAKVAHKLEDVSGEPKPAKKARAKEEEAEEEVEGKEGGQVDVAFVENAVETIAGQLLELRKPVLAGTLSRNDFPIMPDFAPLALKKAAYVRGAKPAPLLGNAIHHYFSGLKVDAGALPFLDDVANAHLFRHSGYEWKDLVDGPLDACPEAVAAMLNGQPALALYLLATAYGSDVPVNYCDVTKALIGCMFRPELGLAQRALSMAQLILLERACMLSEKKLSYSSTWSLYQIDQEVARDICVALIAFLTDGDFKPNGYLVETETSVHAYHMLCMRPVAGRGRDADLFNHMVSNDLLIKKATAAASDDDDDEGPRRTRLHVPGVCTDCTKCVSPADYDVVLMNAQILKCKRVVTPPLEDSASEPSSA